jgi:hypothetical protein
MDKILIFVVFKTFRIFAKYELISYGKEDFGDLYWQQLPEPDGGRIPEIV